MRVDLKIKVLVWSAVIVLCLLIAIGFGLYYQGNILLKTAGWTMHSIEVESAATEAKNAFLSAELKGRYANYDFESKQQYPAAIEKTNNLLEDLAKRVEDNPIQTANARHIIASVQKRFDTQKKSISTVQIVDGQIQSNVQLTNDGVNAQDKALLAFDAFEKEEKNLRSSRLQNALELALFIVKILGGLLCLTLVVGIVSFVWNWWTLKTLKRGAGILKESPDKFIKTESVKQFAAWLEGEVNDLPK